MNDNRGDHLYVWVKRGLVGFVIFCWALTALGVSLTASGTPDAVNMALGGFIWAVISTIALVAWLVMA